MIEAIISSASALLGTVLGFFLSWISRRGHISFNIANSTFEFLHTGDCVEKWEQLATSMEESQKFQIDCDVSAYNSSADIKVVKDPCLFYYCGSAYLFKSVLIDRRRDIEEERENGEAPPELSTFSIPAKSMYELKLRSVIESKKFNRIFTVDKICLHYKDERFKERKTTIIHKPLSEYFDSYKEVPANDNA